jgi:hypothetical protein
MSAPPPPPRKSGALKWVLIGCGVLGFIGLLVCGGCLLWGVGLTKSMIEVQSEVESLVRNSAEVREEIGDVKSVDSINENDRPTQGTTMTMRFHVKGSKGEGEAHARVKFTMTKFTLEGVDFESEEGKTIKLK